MRDNSGGFQNTQPLHLNSLGLSNNEKMNGNGYVLQSESQPILAKANDKPNIMLSSNNSQITVHRRNPSHQFSQQIPINEIPQGSLSGSSGGAYMLKLQKYKKMKSELTNQASKNSIKKNAGTTIQALPANYETVRNNIMIGQHSQKVSANNSMGGASIVQSTKNSQTQQIIFNHPSQIEQSQKENTNLIANSQHYLQFKQQSEQIKHQKSQTLKFSINNLLSEITQKTSNQNHHQINKPPMTAHTSSQSINDSSIQNKLMMQSIIAAKNHSTLLSQKHISSNGSNKSLMQSHQQQIQLQQSQQQSQQLHPQQLVSQKMMMALHKKCNSIANTSNISNYVTNQTSITQTNGAPLGNIRENSQKPQSSNVTCLVLDQDNNSNNTNNNSNFNSVQVQDIINHYQSNQLRQKPSQSNLHLDNYQSAPYQQSNQNQQNSRKNLNQLKQIEFFDENVRVNHVPQITPRHQDKRKTLAVQPNDRYKNIDLLSSQNSSSQNNNSQSHVQQSSKHKSSNNKNNSNAMVSNFDNYYSRKENVSNNQQKNYSSKGLSLSKKQPSKASLIKDAYQSNPNPVQPKIVPNKRYQDESQESSTLSSARVQQPLIDQKTAFEMKRRSCGPSQNEHHQSTIENDLIQDSIQESIKDQFNNVLIQSQRLNQGVFANFGLRKFSQQVQFNNKLITKQDELIQSQHNQQHLQSQVKKQAVSNTDFNTRRQSKGGERQQDMAVKQLKQKLSQRNPKDEIIQFFSKYIKQSKQEQNQLLEQDSEYEETIQNLKDFLQYLEDKSIINCKKLENDKEEMTNLIQDLMKLDLNKFSNKNTSSITCKNSPAQNYNSTKVNKNQVSQQSQSNISNKRNSADYYPYTNLQNDQQQFSMMPAQVYSNIQSPTGQHEKRSIPRNTNSYKHKLPLNSPNQDYASNNNQANSRSTSNDQTPPPMNAHGNIVCYYAPVNVNGNGNIVNTNFQIFPQGSGSSNINSTKNSSHNSVSQSKQFNCSQKLFNSNKNSFDIEEIENINPVEYIGSGLKNSQNIPNQQQQQQQQPIFFQQPPLGQGHKRVNSMSSGLQTKKIVPQNILITPSNQLNNKMNFGFAQQQQQQQYVALDPQEQYNDQVYLKDKHEQLQLKLSGGKKQQDQLLLQAQIQQQLNQQHFHQRKNSHFLQQQMFNVDEDNNIQLRNKFYPQQQQNHQKNIMIQNSQEEDQIDDQAMLQQHKSRLTHRRATTNLIQPSNIQLAKNVQTIQPPTTTNQIVSQNGQAIFNDDIGLIEERDKLINYIKLYTSKRLEIPTTTLDYYKFMKLIGKGAFGKVTLGIHKLTGKQVAIKTVDKSLMKDEYQKKKVLQEVHLLKKVRHQNVIRLLEVFESPKHLLMVMEYAGGGDLLQYVKKRRRLEEDEAQRIFRQVVYGLAHCHCRSVLHRDIKLDNILLDNEGEIKICDFGVSRIIKKNQRITEQCGTPAYIAPEIISDSGYEGFNADVWSLGVLLYAMLCGTVPFKAQNMHDLHQIITSGSFSFPSQVEPLLSNESKDLINKMLVINPQDRISIPEILSHPWMINKDELLLQDDMIDFANGTFLNKKDMYSMGSSTFPSQSINEQTQGSSNEPDINQVLVDNLFLGQNSYKAKLSYTDYCAITQDFATMHMNEEALQVMEGMGFNRKLVREGLNKGELNHATATYNLLVLN